MRIVLDLQAAQQGGATETARAFAASTRDDELWIVLNGALPDAIPALRAAFAAWVPRERIVVFEVPAPLAGDPARIEAARMLREHFIAMLAPDRVVVAGLPLAGTDAVVSVNLYAHAVPTVLLDDGPLPESLAPALAALPVGLVSDNAARAARGTMRHIALQAPIPTNTLLVYHVDAASDTATLLSMMEQHPGAVLLDALPAPAALAADRFDAHGYPALVHGGAAYPGGIALLRAATAILYTGEPVAAAARVMYGQAATRNWLPAGDGPALAVALTTLQARAGRDRPALLHKLAAQRAVPLPQLAYCLAQLPDPLAQRQLLVDVTAIVQHDLKTGIERVVRTQLLDLLRRAPDGLRIEPVYLSDRGGRWHYRYARAYALRLLGLSVPGVDDAEADVRAGDIFYGADYSPHALAAAAHGGLFDYWRARGVALNFVVYDLLPVLRPDFFPATSAQTQAAWLRAVATSADRLLCISAAVAADLADWLAQQHIDAPAIGSLHLGADLEDDAAPMADACLPPGATDAPVFLMVGTIEPRKGHLQAIAAFEQLWAEGVAVNLVIIGHEGWRALPDAERRTIPEIVARLHGHPELNRRLFWLQGPNDAVLRRAYADSACLLAASEGEGFGLPLIEAARYGLPVLARGLPVFREVAQEHASYFDGMAADDLAVAVKSWLDARKSGAAVPSSGMPWLTWRQNVDALLAILQEGTLR